MAFNIAENLRPLDVVGAFHEGQKHRVDMEAQTALTAAFPRQEARAEKRLELEIEGVEQRGEELGIRKQEFDLRVEEYKQQGLEHRAAQGMVAMETPVTRSLMEKAIEEVRQTEDPAEIEAITARMNKRISALIPGVVFDKDDDKTISRDEILELAEILPQIPIKEKDLKNRRFDFKDGRVVDTATGDVSQEYSSADRGNVPAAIQTAEYADKVLRNKDDYSPQMGKWAQGVLEGEGASTAKIKEVQFAESILQDGESSPEKVTWATNYLGGEATPLPAAVRTAMEADSILADPESSPALKAWAIRQTQGAQTESAKQIKSMVEQGVAQHLAENIAYGRVDLQINDKTGRMVLIEEVTQKATEIPIELSAALKLTKDGSLPITPKNTLFKLAEHGTGIGSAAAAALDFGAAFAGFPTEMKATFARQTLKAEIQNLVRALSINQRFPLGEMERIRDDVSITPAIFDDPILMRTRMIALRDSLTERARNADIDGADPDNSDVLRESQKSNATHIRNFLVKLGVPDDKGTLPDGVPEGSKFIGFDRDKFPVYQDKSGGKWVID